MTPAQPAANRRPVRVVEDCDDAFAAVVEAAARAGLVPDITPLRSATAVRQRMGKR